MRLLKRLIKPSCREKNLQPNTIELDSAISYKKSIIDGRIYSSKLLEVYAAEENNDLIILTVIVKYGKR